MTHGGAGDNEGHVGDLGNIQADDQGVARFNITSMKIRLDGRFSVLACVLFFPFSEGRRSLTARSGMDRRALVVHAVRYIQPTLSGL